MKTMLRRMSLEPLSIQRRERRPVTKLSPSKADSGPLGPSPADLQKEKMPGKLGAYRASSTSPAGLKILVSAVQSRPSHYFSQLPARQRISLALMQAKRSSRAARAPSAGPHPLRVTN